MALRPKVFLPVLNGFAGLSHYNSFLKNDLKVNANSAVVKIFIG
ncbi:MAG: hypothetical protein ACPL1K_00440 [Candidatus Kryptoniota bacterium]